jgi:ribonuclease III
MNQEERSTLESLLGYTFSRPEFLERSLTHRSRREGVPGSDARDNESLEFLGDRVVGLIVSERLFETFRDWDAGKLSKALAHLVSSTSLYSAAQQLRLGSYLRLGRGEEKTGGREKHRLLADAYEAVVAAIYCDGGLTAASSFVERTLLRSAMAGREGVLHYGDHKSVLQEWLQQHGLGTIEYHISRETGPDHQKMFEVEARLNGRRLFSSTGRSKKEAEQFAARGALACLQEELTEREEIE